MQQTNIKIFDTKQELADTAAQYVVEMANEYISKHGRFSVALSGGSTPKILYNSLVRNYKDAVEWSKVDFFWSDERYVPIDHNDSNMKLAIDNLLNPLGISTNSCYFIETSLANPAGAADKYEKGISAYFEKPEFDLILLGLGDDGHTASLFPRTKALEEKEKLVIANWVEKFKTWRITFTYPLLNAAKNVIFLAAGEGKSGVVKEILQEKKPYPAALVKPNSGKLFWLLDKQAASQLELQNE